MAAASRPLEVQLVRIPVPSEKWVLLEAMLVVPGQPRGVVLFAHGSGSGRNSPRNRAVARRLQEAGLATLLVDLLTEEDERVDSVQGHLRFNIPFLADRLAACTEWLAAEPLTAGLPVGYFGASTGGGAALLAAAENPDGVKAIVSRGGRPDLAGDALRQVIAPTLLIVGAKDSAVIPLNQAALERLASPIRKLVLVPGATHLFEEPGTLEVVAHLAADWFTTHLGGIGRTPSATPE